MKTTPPTSERQYYVKINGVTFLGDAKAIQGWLRYILNLGGIVHVEKVELAS